MLIRNIGLLAGILPPGVGPLRGHGIDRVETLADAWLLTDDGGRIADFGPMSSCPPPDGAETLDARGALVTPTFCDCHTHLVYAGSREGEFRDKIQGLGYAEIAARGGGILNSAARVASASEDELYEESLGRLREIAAMGTGAVEIKSGYGLTLESELKILRVIRRLAAAIPGMTVRATFLGAHAVGPAFRGRQEDYVDHVIRDMIPAVAAEGLADYIDVFCEKGFFTTAQTRRILLAGQEAGMRPRLHADQLSRSGGTRVGVEAGAISVDHLEAAEEAEIAFVAQSDTIAVGLPGASFFNGDPYAPARRLIDAGAIFALASDYNPGTSPSGSMKFVWSLGCIKMRLTPEQGLNAVTINAAAALGLQDTHGSITRGKAANLIVYTPETRTLAMVPYAYTSHTIATVILGGEAVCLP